MPKRTQMSFRTTPERCELIRQLAAKSGRSVGDYMVARATEGEIKASVDRLYVRSALRFVARTNDPARRRPFWGLVMELLGVGSTTAAQICAEYGFHEETGEERGARNESTKPV